MNMTIIRALSAIAAVAALLATAGCNPGAAQDNDRIQAAIANEQQYSSPFGVKYSADGSLLAVTDATRGQMIVINPADANINRTVSLKGYPRGLAWSGNNVYVAQYDAWTVSEINAATGEIMREFEVGPKPVDVAVSGSKMVVTEFGLGKLIVIDLVTGEREGEVRVKNYPYSVEITPDGNQAIVAHKLPTGNAMAADFAATIAFVDLNSLTVTAEVKLPHGSSNVREMDVSKDGKWIYVAHTLGKTNLPTTHVHKGWVNTNALTVIDLEQRDRHATLLLDRISTGASDPWGVALSKDGNTLWVSIAGTHEVVRLDMEHLHLLMAGEGPSFQDDLARNMRYRSKAAFDRSYSDVWLHVSDDPGTNRALLKNDLGALWGAGVMEVIALPGEGPRGIDVSSINGEVAVASYFDGTVYFIDPGTNRIARSAVIGNNHEESAARRGERYFHDGTLTMQNWLSCATCHPGGRADGLNWDLPNDGLGNPNNTKTMLLALETPPAMARGVRDSAYTAIGTGFRFISFSNPGQEVIDDVSAYMASLQPERSPYRERDGSLTAQAQAGKVIFESDHTSCVKCHYGPYFTDNKMHDVGTRNEVDSDGRFVTPHLIELWRRAPFNHDGQAVTMRDVLTTFNKDDRHGKTSHLTDTEIDNLAAYLLQLCLDTAPQL